MRIVGGLHRGRVLSSPQGLGTRPTSDRVRQSIFNILEHASWLKKPVLQGAPVLDLFAGTGALGLEALSRGAAHAIFVEQNPEAVRACIENIESLHLEERCAVHRKDVFHLTFRPPHMEPRSLIFLDPPYGKELGTRALKILKDSGWIADEAVIVMEMAKKQPEPLPEGFILQDERVYGVAQVRFLTTD